MKGQAGQPETLSSLLRYDFQVFMRLLDFKADDNMPLTPMTPLLLPLIIRKTYGTVDESPKDTPTAMGAKSRKQYPKILVR
jgi:hypothetical protein